MTVFSGKSENYENLNGIISNDDTMSIKGITERGFGSLQVLKGIDLHINKGEVVGIVGPSGAGKTTLLQNHWHARPP